MIDILMSTYNGADFIGPQIESILAQYHRDFRLIVRDDGSTDGTLNEVERYAAADERVSIIHDYRGNLGVRGSFMSLVERSEAPYFMLADQDDVWGQGKIASSLTKINELQASFGDDVPLLVFTDLTVVESDLTVVDRSLWHYQRLDPSISQDWRDLLAQNVVTGSTIIANAAARRASLPFALEEMMHDHWIAVNVARSGHIAYLTTPTVLYRQHEENAEGARRAGGRYLAGNAGKLMRKKAFYRRAAAHFGGVRPRELFFRKVRLNLRRLFGSGDDQ